MSLLCQACGNFSWVQLCSGQTSKSRYQQFCCSCDPLMFHLPFACRVILRVIFLLASGDWNNDFLHQLGRLPINRWQVSIDMLDHVPGAMSLEKQLNLHEELFYGSRLMSLLYSAVMAFLAQELEDSRNTSTLIITLIITLITDIQTQKWRFSTISTCLIRTSLVFSLLPPLS